MSEFQEQSDTIEVPRGTGIDGFVAVIRGLLKLPRVQYINIDGNGRVRYARVVRKGEAVRPADLDFSSLYPSTIIRNAQLKELPEERVAAFAIAKMFQAASYEKLYPISFVTNPKTTLWQWHDDTTGINIAHSEDSLYGVPLLFDENIPAYVLVLCTGYMPGSPMSETRKSFKITMPQYGQGG